MRGMAKMSREEEISKVRTALWMAEKLARLCRETIRARNAGDFAQIERLAEEIGTFVESDGFISAVETVSPEYFYPDVLRNILVRLKNGQAETIREAIRLAGE